MKVVIAVDSFKGSVAAPEACRAIAEGMCEGNADIKVVERPMADGGEGTARVLLSVMGGSWEEREVMGPFAEQRVKAGFAWFPERRTGLVEMAAASGLALLDPGSLDPMRATTYGTGQLLAAAASHGAERILLAVGGSATVDGGAGAASALGWQLQDGQARDVALGGGQLRQVQALVWGRGPTLPEIRVLCDVRSPLLGPSGAARVFGPQKGATPEMVRALEEGLRQFAHCVYQATGRDIRTIPGGGAAGGLAAGAYGLLGAELTPGAEAVLDAIELRRDLSGADWVVTGEGKFDGQSAEGKVVSAVVDAGRAAGVKTAVIAGVVEVAPEAARAMGIDAIEPSSPAGMPVEEAMAAGASLLRDAGRRFARLHLGA